MIIEHNIVIEGKHGKPIVSDVYYSDKAANQKVVIFCHGYKGFKDWGAWDLLAKSFAKQNYFFIKFNFSHNGGTIEQPIDFPDLEAFGQNNYTKELDDLEVIINWIYQHNEYENYIDKENITLIGHSRGGGIVTIKASENPYITNIISLAGVSDYGIRFPSGEQLKNWKENGVAYIENSRTKQQMPHYYQFYEDFKTNEDRLNIKNACKHLIAKHLIVHGSSDEVVTELEAKNLHLWNPKSSLSIIPNANHTFGASHPYNEDHLPKDLKIAFNTIISFLNNEH